MSGHALNKQQMLDQARLFYYAHPQGITDIELAAHLGVTRITANRYRRELGAEEISYGRYTLPLDANVIKLAEAVALRLKGGR